MWVERHAGGCSCRVWEFDCEGEDSVVVVGDDGEVLVEAMKDPCLLSSRVNRGRGGYWLSILRSRQCKQVELCSLYYESCVSGDMWERWWDSKREMRNGNWTLQSHYQLKALKWDGPRRSKQGVSYSNAPVTLHICLASLI